MDPYIGEIRVFGFTFAPRNWAKCDGQLLPIAQHTALFSVLGPTYGGDGKTSFALPNLEGRAAMNHGQGPGLTAREIGEEGGSDTVTLTVDQMPAHNHLLRGSQQFADSTQPEDRVVGRPTSSANMYAGTSDIDRMAPDAIAHVGNGMPHNNMQPYLKMNFCIALQGVFPPRS